MKSKLLIFQILFVLSFLLVNSCVTTNTVKTENPNVFKAKDDKFNPNIKDLYTSSEVKVKESGLIDTRAIWFYLNYQNTNNQKLWTINLLYHGNNWMFVNGIKLLIDGDLLEYRPIFTPKREVMSMGGVSCAENVVFQIDEDLFAKINKARNVSVRIIGDKSSYDTDFTELDINIFNEFYSYIRESFMPERVEKMPTEVSGAVTNEEIQKEVKTDEYIYIKDHKDLKIFMNDYVGKKIRIRLYMNTISTPELAFFMDADYGTYFINYANSPIETKKKLNKIEKGEPCFIKGTFSDNMLGENAKRNLIMNIELPKVMHITVDTIELIPPPDNNKINFFPMM